MMPHPSKPFMLAGLALAASLTTAAPARAALVYASADMDIGSLRFSAANKDAKLVWADDWFGTVTAQAQDSDSGSDGDYAQYLGNDGAIVALAQTDHVYSRAAYRVTHGLSVAMNPDAAVVGTTHSDLLLFEKGTQADGSANVTFDNFFMVTGGTAGDPVDISFTLDYDGQLTGIADKNGFFAIAIGALLQLYDVDQITGDVTDRLADDIFTDSHSGTNTSFQRDYQGTLSVSHSVLFGDRYWLYAEADSEIYGAAPEPAGLALLLLGAGILARRRSRQPG